MYKEISSVVKSHGNENLDYAAIMEMKYLDKVFHESQRFYSFTFLERACGKDYKVPGMDLIIPKNTAVRIPVTAICKDSIHYENPEEFNPENFSEEKKAKRSAYVTGSFGYGPRNCIAVRFATLEVKIAIARILNEFKVLPCNKTVDKLIPDPVSRAVLPKGGIWFTVEKRVK